MWVKAKIVCSSWRPCICIRAGLGLRVPLPCGQPHVSVLQPLFQYNFLLQPRGDALLAPITTYVPGLSSTTGKTWAATSREVCWTFYLR